jgi:hypothetical protein
LDYIPSEFTIWKSYFGRYTTDLRPTLESTEGEYSHSHAYWHFKNENQLKAKALYQTYMQIMEARESLSQCALTAEELHLLMEIE